MFGPPIESLTFRERWQFVKTLVSIDIKHGVPRLVVHEKYERVVKWTLRGLALIGVVVAGISFNAWYYGVGVAILILVFQQVFERVLFEYTAIHVSAMPFHYDPAQWLAVAFMFSSNEAAPDIIGPAFRDRAYAEEIMNVIRSWNYGQDEDPNDFIRLSFIMEGPESYSIYIYPAPRRPSVQKFFDEYEVKAKEEKQGKRLMRLAVSMTFCKLFPRKNSLLPQFHSRNTGTRPFLFTTFFREEGGFTPLVDSAVMKSSYRFSNRDMLTKSDYEFGHGKRFLKGKFRKR